MAYHGTSWHISSISMLHFETLLYCRRCVSGTLAEDGKKSSVLSFLQVQTGLRVEGGFYAVLGFAQVQRRNFAVCHSCCGEVFAKTRGTSWHVHSCRANGCHVVNEDSRPCPSWCALPKLTSWWWNCQSLEIDVVLNLMGWGWTINGWPVMIHEVTVVDDGGGGYYINFSEVGLISLCGPGPFGSWFLMLSLIYWESQRWCLMEANRIQDDVLSISSPQEWIMLHICTCRYWYHVDALVGLSVLLQWQGGKADEGETTFSEARRQSRWYLLTFFVFEIWWLFVVWVDTCYCNDMVSSDIDWDFCD